MQKELKLFSIAKVMADMYKSRYDKADKKRKEAWNDLNRNFVKGSPKFQEYKKRIEPEFQEEIGKAKAELFSDFEKEFNELREHEIARVKVITPGAKEMIDVLGRLQNIPISVDEFNFLVEQYGNHSYWTDRHLANLGVKNGIQECNVAPDITTRLGVLDELKSNLESYFEKYNGDFVYGAEVLVADSTLQRLEKQYTNNYAGISLNAAETAKRIVTDALNKLDSMESSMYLANSLRTSSPKVKESILYELCKNHDRIAEIPCMRLAGVSSAMENFKESEYKGICKAEKTIERIKGESRKYEQETIVYQNLGDRHFIDAVAQSGDNDLKEMVKHMREVKEVADEKERREAAENKQTE